MAMLSQIGHLIVMHQISNEGAEPMRELGRWVVRQ